VVKGGQPMNPEDDAQAFVRQRLATRPVDQLPAGFTSRLADRLDRERSLTWLALLNWRMWSLRLLPAAVVLWIWAAFGGHAGVRSRPVDLGQYLVAWQTGGGVSVLVTSPDVSDSSLLVALLWEDQQ
jgi:hypothetical protein